MRLELDDQEARKLLDLLEICYCDMRVEIAQTQNDHMRQFLRDREPLLRVLMERLAARPTTSAT
ncbi:MAG: hypothetical protein HW397_60 [Dehalococcoidia bacterium]|jgi:hypothetical protein|nr:hypothetical protein [Dehalococcoidia bacterium]